MLIARLTARLIARFDGPRMARRSAELQTFGWHVIARKPADPDQGDQTSQSEA
jgi:hypothetical protein